MILRIQPESEEPIYRQLVSQLIMGLARGELRPGETLAPVRQLATELGINMHTAAKVYQVLQQEGYLVNNRQKGFTVASGMPSADNVFREHFIDRLSQAVAEAALRGMSREDCLKACAQAYDDIRKE